MCIIYVLYVTNFNNNIATSLYYRNGDNLYRWRKLKEKKQANIHSQKIWVTVSILYCSFLNNINYLYTYIDLAAYLNEFLFRYAANKHVGRMTSRLEKIHL